MIEEGGRVKLRSNKMVSIEEQINNFYIQENKTASNLLDYPNEINEEFYRMQRQYVREKEQKIILAIGSVDPYLALNIQEAIDIGDQSSLKHIAERIEKEIYPDGTEIYKLDGEGFLKIIEEREDNNDTIKIMNKFELIKE